MSNSISRYFQVSKHVGEGRNSQKIMTEKQQTVSLKEAAEAFGIEEKELEQTVAFTFGILSVADAARLVGINYDTLWSAANPNKKRHRFPDALPAKPGGTRYINILHPQFVTWYRDNYKPHRTGPKPDPHPCKLNEVAGQTYTDKDGVQRTVEPCPNLVEDGVIFCSVDHFREYRSATGGWSVMGKKGDPALKGARGPRKRSAEDSAKRSLAASKGRAGSKATEEEAPPRMRSQFQ
jgi:hypothetical protein